MQAMSLQQAQNLIRTNKAELSTLRFETTTKTGDRIWHLQDEDLVLVAQLAQTQLLLQLTK